MPSSSRTSPNSCSQKPREIRFTWNANRSILTQGKNQSTLENKALFQREYNSLLNFDTGIQLSLTITNDLSLEMRVTVRLSGVSTNRLSYSIVYVVPLTRLKY